MLASGLADNHSVTHLDLSHNKASRRLCCRFLVTPTAGGCRAGREWHSGVLVIYLDLKHSRASMVPCLISGW